MKKLADYLTVIIFFAFCIFPLAGTAFAASTGDSISRSSGSGEYLKNSFPLKDRWDRLYSVTARSLGQREFGGVYYDEAGGRLIKLFTDYNENALELSIDAINKYKKQHSRMPVYSMIVPTASGVYREDLPAALEAIDQQKLIDDIYYRLDEDVVPLDVFSGLYAVRDSYIYFRTDDRWTQHGAYEAYKAAARKLGASPYGAENYDIEFTNLPFYGELSKTSYITDIQSDMIDAYRCKYGSYIRSCSAIRERQIYTKASVYSRGALQNADKYTFFLGSTDYRSVPIDSTASEQPRILMIGSDYSNCFLPFLAPNYSCITLVNPAELQGKKLTDIVTPEEYDLTLFLFDVETFCEGITF
ncbi:MAG: hypothetical protein IJ723_00385 [Ruminococcus sp.]|nr:hypothetical protein [Ruminococcus sp.]